VSEQPTTPAAEPAAVVTPDGRSGRIDPSIKSLRSHAARGTLLNSGFEVGIAGLGFLQRTVTAIFLTRAEFGLWAIVLTVLVNLAWLKQVGIMDKFVQQSEPDQEAAFQKAFTLELIVSLAFFVIAVAVLPLWAIAYGHEEIILPGVIVAATVPMVAFETATWIPYRRLQYGRQRLLMSVNPVVSFVVTIALGMAGAGYWCFVGGVFAGAAASAIVNAIVCPYPLRLRIDRQTVKEYAHFSWPLFGSGVSRLVVVQGSLLIVNATAGLGAVGVIGLATGIAVFADRIDSLVSQTIYPAVCAVTDRTELLFEIFVKSNRVALMWAMPFGVILALFAEDIVRFILGERWLPGVWMIQVFGLTCAFGQLAFNWTVFQRALNRTKPLFVAAVADLAVFAIVGIPAMIAYGLEGYAISFVTTTSVQVLLRSYFMGRMFQGFRLLRQLVRAVLPAAPGALLVLGLRALEDGERTPALALGELVLYVLATAASTWLLERKLLLEIVSYVFKRQARAAPTPS
jgi:O-antigen/teichoic acid export membrane protein